MTATPPEPPSLDPPAIDSDLQLVERTVAGDQKAYELLVLKYQRRIERLIGRTAARGLESVWAAHEMRRN